MPKHRVHRLFERLILGEDYGWVDRYMDEPFKYLGRKHRVLRHSIPDCVEIYLKTRDPKAFAAAILHLLLDEVL